MIIDTVKFGTIEIDETRIFDFELPIIGFDELHKFIILDPNPDSLFKWLQAIEAPDLAFPIISVASLEYEYSIDLADSVIKTLDIQKPESLLVMNITSIPQDNPKGTTINLLAPLIFNLDNQIAGQIVLSGSGYDISYPMFKNN